MGPFLLVSGSAPWQSVADAPGSPPCQNCRRRVAVAADERAAAVCGARCWLGSRRWLESMTRR